MDTIKYQIDGIFEVIFRCLSDTINSITSFLDYIFIERTTVLIFLFFIMLVISVPIGVYLWDVSEEKECDSKLQKIKFFKSFFLMIMSFVFVALFYVGISDLYINSNLTTETDDVVLVEKGMKNIRVSEEGHSSFATGGVKFIGKRGYSVNGFKEKPSFNEAFFKNNHLKGTTVNVDNDVYNDLKFNKDPKNIRLKYYFYKKGSGNPRMIVAEYK